MSNEREHWELMQGLQKISHEFNRRFDDLERRLTEERKHLMSTLTDLAEAVQKNTDATGAIETVIGSLLDQISAANAAGKNDAAIEALVSQIRANTSALVQSALANTPAAPVPTPAPAPAPPEPAPPLVTPPEPAPVPTPAPEEPLAAKRRSHAPRG